MLEDKEITLNANTNYTFSDHFQRIQGHETSDLQKVNITIMPNKIVNCSGATSKSISPYPESFIKQLKAHEFALLLLQM